MKYLKSAGLFILLIFSPFFLFAKGGNSAEIDWFLIIIGLFGGLALFLYGMEKMSDALKKTAGDGLRRILTALSKNRFIGMLVGAIVTMVIQSSSATTVMLVSFVNSGLMSFTQTLSIILGANIGTTITAQIVAFKLTDYSVLFIAVGFFAKTLTKKQTLKNIGNTLLGFGILFYGMEMMSEAMSPLRTYEPFVDALKGLDNLIVSVLVGMLFTALIQSSSAFIGIIIVMSMQGFVGLYAGIGMILGANIGTCVTAFLATLNTNRAAKRVAAGHIIFKILGVIFFIFWIPQFEKLIIFISDYMNADAGRRIANAHTFFNIINAFVMLPFTGLFAKLIVRIVPDKETDQKYQPQIKHLDYNLISNPPAAISLARAEISNTVSLVKDMVDNLLPAFFNDKMPMDKKYTELEIIEALNVREKKIDFLEAKTTEYLIKINNFGLTEEQSKEVFSLITTSNYLENIADVVIDDILPLIYKKQMLKSNFSEQGKNDIIDYHLRIMKQLSRLQDFFKTNDLRKANKLIKKYEKYTKLDSEFRIKHYQRMSNDEKSILTHKIHIDLLDHFQQIGFRIDNIVKTLSKSQYGEDFEG